MEEVLINIGFSSKEAKVYLACLELGKNTVYNIAAKAGLKRPTVYLMLDNLMQKGLVGITKTKKAIYYTSVHPSKLLKNFQNKEKMLAESLIGLESLYNVKAKKPVIQTYEGLKSVESLYTEIADYARLKGKEILAVGTVAYLENYSEILNNIWLKKIRSKKCHIREILNNDNYNKNYLAKVNKFNNKNHKIKFILKNFPLFKNDNMIFDNKIALFSTHRDLYVIVIESQSLTDTFKAFFELAWHAAKSAK